ncbi:MAG: hypothetical protein ACMXYL_05555 [Candidatus Woesearchaeota archaeon]
MSLSNHTRSLIDDAKYLFEETYQAVGNPKILISVVRDCHSALSSMLVDIMHKRGITLGKVPEYYGDIFSNNNIVFEVWMREAVVQHDIAAGWLKHYDAREVDFYRNETYYMIADNNHLVGISASQVRLMINASMRLYEEWYTLWKNP